MLLSALSPWIGWSMLASTALVVAVSLWFYKHQQRGGMGGRASGPKGAWLCFAILYWLFLCPLLGSATEIPSPWRVTLLVFSINFWIRGVVELIMLYVTKNWRPRHGISHDIFSLLLVLGLLLALGIDATSLEGWGVGGAIATATLLLSLGLETYYAVVFNQLVAGQTTGDEGVWFADPSDPKFQRVNRVTYFFNLPLYAALIFLLLSAWGTFS